MHERGLNHLAAEKSPYLKQHAHNPVDWYPWGEEAFQLAKKLDKPIFLSIGYSTCHWCHVMAHESFENEEIAALMNETFVNIKVDREEHPDVDQLYMTVCQMMTGRGGWPLTIIMTPDRVPFYAATYIPPHTAFGRPGMKELIPQIADVWNHKRAEVEKASQQIKEQLTQAFSVNQADVSFELMLDNAYQNFESAFDSTHGGFGKAPKFPSPHQFLFLLRYGVRTGSSKAIQMVESTLQHMKRGGIYDHVGFGFHRYSTDAEWKLPHFEKMLYDQAMLMLAFAETALITGKDEYGQTIREIFAYLQDKLLSTEGAYYAAEDADSDGEEGKFYVWSTRELKDVLTESEYRLVKHLFATEQDGNFREESTGTLTGQNVLFKGKSDAMINQILGISDSERREQWENIRLKLKAHRELRVKPGLDDKILSDWNGLLMAALASAGKLPGNEAMITAAQSIARFIKTKMTTSDGRLWHSFSGGEATIHGKLDDYAFLIWGLTELYQVTFNEEYLLDAWQYLEKCEELFWDEGSSVYYMSEVDNAHLITRPVEFYDGAIPSGNSVMAWNLIRFYHITGKLQLKEQAEQLIRANGSQLERYPNGYTMLLNALEFELGNPAEIVIAANNPQSELKELLTTLRKEWHPNLILIGNPTTGSKLSDKVEFLKYQNAIDGQTTYYLCHNQACEQPVTSLDKILSRLRKSGH